MTPVFKIPIFLICYMYVFPSIQAAFRKPELLNAFSKTWHDGENEELVVPLATLAGLPGSSITFVAQDGVLLGVLKLPGHVFNLQFTSECESDNPRSFSPSLGSTGANVFSMTVIHKSAESSPKIGPIGESSPVQYFCIFYTNFTYTCRQQCENEDNLKMKTFPDEPNKGYYDLNCDKESPSRGIFWGPRTDSLVHRLIDPSKANQIVATCVMHESMWYECNGVADCSRGTKENSCHGGAPWRGFYEGNPQTGFTGNVTFSSMSNPLGNPEDDPVLEMSSVDWEKLLGSRPRHSSAPPEQSDGFQKMLLGRLRRLNEN